MAEGEDKKINIDTENLKNQTKDTVKQVKDTIKDVNFKDDAKEATGFVKEMFIDPLEGIKKVANEEEHSFKRTIVIMIAYIALYVLYEITYVLKYRSLTNFTDNILSIVVAFIHPILAILVPAIVVLVMNKNNKKTLTVVISTLVVATIPVVLVTGIDIIERVLGGIKAIYLITSPISTGLSVASTLLTYFGVKELFGEKDHGNFIKTYVIIEVISAFGLYILSTFNLF